MTEKAPENQGLPSTQKNEIQKLFETHQQMSKEDKEGLKKELDNMVAQKIPFYKLLLDMNGGDSKKLESVPLIGPMFKMLNNFTNYLKFMTTGDLSGYFGKDKDGKDKSELNTILTGTLEKIKGTNYYMPIVSIGEAKEAGYHADSGLDIYAPKGTPAHSMANGKIIYSEKGHTPWQASEKNPHDTGNSILIELDEPLKKNGKIVTTPDGKPVKYIWYTHMAELTHDVKEGSEPKRIEAGEIVGKTGVGNNSPHLHLGLLSNRS